MGEPKSASQQHKLALMPSGHQGQVPAGATVLEAARSLGVELESICGGRQTCGKCLIEHEIGDFPKLGLRSDKDHLTAPEAVETTYAADEDLDLSERRLGCAVRIVGDVLISVPTESLARKQVIRKEAGDVKLEVGPAVRLVYVEVEPGQLGGEGDWERTQKALHEQWQIAGATIDPKALTDLSSALRLGEGAMTLTIWGKQQVIRIEPGYNESLYGVAIDIGSTTLACYLCDLRTGDLLATESAMNPQIRYGEDLMSRISYVITNDDGSQRLHRAIITALGQLASDAADSAGIRPAEITDMVLVGNTVMHHLALGIDPTALGSAPFTLTIADAVDLKARDLGLKAVHHSATVHVLPCVAGHVGADNVGVMLAHAEYLDDRVSLIVDIGTNAEILLGTRERLLSASTPTGPALEGAQITHGQRAAPGAIERVRIDRHSGDLRFSVIGAARWSDELPNGESLRPTGICGSGVVEIVASLYQAGFIDKTGLFRKEATERSDRLRFTGRAGEYIVAHAHESGTGSEIVFKQTDIRAIQLAKAALYAGIRILMNHLGVERVDRIALAGAFGNHIDPTYAMILGMIPDCDLSQVRGVGNAAGDGARIALLNADHRREAGKMASAVDYVELAVEPSFQEHFVEAMNLPHARDSFPNLDGMLPSDTSRPSRRQHRLESRSGTPEDLV
jgi:uncharacterized 2Fe-2S/4Fe-4S cluster protein (DUF4445 family)